MAILSPMRDVGEALLTTLATSAVGNTAVPIVEVDVHARLPKTASKCPAKPLVEMEPQSSEGHDSLLDDLDDMEESSEADVLEELPTRSRHARVTTARCTTASEDAFQSYVRDIRRFGLLTHEEEIDLARRTAAGDEQARMGIWGSCAPPRNLTIAVAAILAPMPPGGFARQSAVPPAYRHA